MKPTIGRIVHYVLPGSGKHRPALIVEDWGNGKAEAVPMGSACNLRVFLDGSNDGSDWKDSGWPASVCYDAEMKGGTWHWPERD
jgi:hypothetical protein